MVNVHDINNRLDLSRRYRHILNCGWLICGGWIDELCWRLDKEIKVKDILKEKEKEIMKKFIGENVGAISEEYQGVHSLVTDNTVVPPSAMTRDTYEKKEREALMERIKAMDEKQLAIVAECIPFEICIGRIMHEYQQLEALRDSVRNAIGNF